MSLDMSMSPNWIDVSIESTVGGSQKKVGNKTSNYFNISYKYTVKYLNVLLQICHHGVWLKFQMKHH